MPTCLFLSTLLNYLGTNAPAAKHNLETWVIVLLGKRKSIKNEWRNIFWEHFLGGIQHRSTLGQNLHFQSKNSITIHTIFGSKIGYCHSVFRIANFFLSYPFITNSNRVCGTSKCHSHFATFFFTFLEVINSFTWWQLIIFREQKRWLSGGVKQKI